MSQEQAQSWMLVAIWIVMWLGSAGWLLVKGRRALGIWSIVLGWMAPIVPFVIACAAVNQTKLDARNMAVAYAAQAERERQTALLSQFAVTQKPITTEGWEVEAQPVEAKHTAPAIDMEYRGG